MKDLSALIFPETEPSRRITARLLIFFDSLSYYRPVEAAAAGNRDPAFPADLCSPHVPAPLTGQDLYRFNRLLREMERSRPDELARLFSAVTAPVAAGRLRDQDETSAARVYSTLQTDPESRAGSRRQERLWQARLVLKLAEMLDKREAEVRQGLGRVSAAEQKIFAALAGSDKSGAEELAGIESFARFNPPAAEDVLPEEASLGTSGLLVPLRLKAWAELFLADSHEPPVILATASTECLAILQEGYEKIRHRPPLNLFSLPLPQLRPADHETAWSAYLAERIRCREAVRENLIYFNRCLLEAADRSELTGGNRKKWAALPENRAAWEKNLDHCFPGPINKGGRLDFYSFPGTTYAELFQRLFRLENQGPEKNQARATPLLTVYHADSLG